MSESAAPSSSNKAPTVIVRTPADVDRLLESGSPYLDVRTPAEFNAGHPPKAINVDFLGASSPAEFVAAVVAALPSEGANGAPIVIGCKSGRRSANAAALLKEAKYHPGGILIDLGGGFDAWLSGGFAVEK